MYALKEMGVMFAFIENKQLLDADQGSLVLPVYIIHHNIMLYAMSQPCIASYVQCDQSSSGAQPELITGDTHALSSH